MGYNYIRSEWLNNCEVWRSNVQKYPWRSKCLPWNVLVYLCIFHQVLRALFGWNWCEGSLTWVKTIFRLETSRKNSPRTRQRVLEEHPCVSQKMSKPASPMDGNRCLVTYTMLRRWWSQWILSLRIVSSYFASI